MFQFFFAEDVCSALDASFSENDLISCFRIVNPTNMPLGQASLQNWCIPELDHATCRRDF